MYIMERTSRLANWSIRLAFIAVMIFIGAIICHHISLIETDDLLLYYIASALLGLIAIVLSFMAFGRIWITGDRGWRKAFFALLAGLVVWVPVMISIPALLNLPYVNDISTNLDDPPELRNIEKNSEITNRFEDPDLRQSILQAYPEVISYTFEYPPSEIFKIVEQLILELGWEITDREVPFDDVTTGEISAIDRSMIFNFPDDITVRIAANRSGSTVDMRSASIYGEHDLGANAKRIADFLQHLTVKIEEFAKSKENSTQADPNKKKPDEGS